MKIMKKRKKERKKKERRKRRIEDKRNQISLVDIEFKKHLYKELRNKSTVKAMHQGSNCIQKKQQEKEMTSVSSTVMSSRIC